jgi:death-on-curing protein
MPDILFLDVHGVLLIHEDAIRKDGGLAGARDRGLLESAVAMPRQQFGGQYLHDSPAAMAAAYLYHIAQNHPFLDGNKRAAVMAAYVFLDNNGWDVTAAPAELEAVTRKVAAGLMSKEALTRWLQEHTARRRHPHPPPARR